MASHLQGLPAIASRRRMHKHKWLCKYGSLFDPEIYEIAICNVRSRTGRRRKVPGEPNEFAFDTFFEDMVPRIIQQMRDRSFQFMPIQTEPILQPEGKTRLIATPSLVDDVMQEALRLILEPAFAKSHIHARSACPPLHSARLTMQRVRMWTGTTWLISANRNGFLDNINHTVLAQMIGRDVKDQQILDLYWKLVNAGLVNSGNQEPHNLTAVSKGGILWPLFTDIYLSDFDVWLQDLSSNLQRQLSNGGNKLRKGIERGIQGGGARIHYIRYGDQWLVGVDGPKSVAVKIKDDIAMYLNMNLKLNIENDDIAITHLATEKCKYLGMLISTRDRKYTESLVGKSADYAYGQIVLEAPINELVTKLVERGFAVNPEYPRGMSGWIYLEAEEIMRRYRSIIRSLMNYYSIVDNKNMLRRVFWILRFSAIFTLCRKWRMSTRALFKKLATDPKYADFLKGRVASSRQ